MCQGIFKAWTFIIFSVVAIHSGLNEGCGRGFCFKRNRKNNFVTLISVWQLLLQYERLCGLFHYKCRIEIYLNFK
jgi:hypothetical protein